MKTKCKCCWLFSLMMVIPFIAELNMNAALTQNLPHLSSTELYPPGKSILLPSSGGKCIHKTLFIWQLASPLPSNCSTQWQAAKCSQFFLFSSHISVNNMFLLTTFKESAKHVSLRLADTSHLADTVEDTDFLGYGNVLLDKNTSWHLYPRIWRHYTP